ncbi:MAG: hypothetical protein FJ398_24855 [Verrucomicrobia bacterium]|nr:hypothetical protein [Verrucomicrobiota bacterium]
MKHPFSEFLSISNSIESAHGGSGRFRFEGFRTSRRLFLRDPPPVQATMLKTWKELLLAIPGDGEGGRARRTSWVKLAFLLALLLFCTGLASLHFLRVKTQVHKEAQKSAEQQLHDEQLQKLMRGFQVREARANRVQVATRPASSMDEKKDSPAPSIRRSPALALVPDRAVSRPVNSAVGSPGVPAPQFFKQPAAHAPVAPSAIASAPRKATPAKQLARTAVPPGPTKKPTPSTYSAARTKSIRPSAQKISLSHRTQSRPRPTTPQQLSQKRSNAARRANAIAEPRAAILAANWTSRR